MASNSSGEYKGSPKGTFVADVIDLRKPLWGRPEGQHRTQTRQQQQLSSPEKRPMTMGGSTGPGPHLTPEGEVWTSDTQPRLQGSVQ